MVNKRILYHVSLMLRIIFVVGILWYFFSKKIIDLDTILNLKLRLSFLMFIFIIISEISFAFRWLILLLAQGIKISLTKAFQLNLIGSFFTLFTPGSYSGDLVRVFYAVRNAKGFRTKVTLSILFDRFIGLQTLLIMGGVSAIVNLYLFGTYMPPQLKIISTLIIAISIGSICFVFFFMTVDLRSNRFLIFFKRKLGERVGGILHRITECFIIYRSNLRKLGLAYTFSVTNQFILISSYYFAEWLLRFKSIEDGQSYDPVIGFINHMLLDPIVIIITAIPVSPMSIGLRAGAFSFLYSMVGNSFGAEIGFFITITWALWFAVAGGLSFIFMQYSDSNIFSPKNKIEESML